MVYKEPPAMLTNEIPSGFFPLQCAMPIDALWKLGPYLIMWWSGAMSASVIGELMGL